MGHLWLWPGDHRGVVGDAGEQLARLLQQVLERSMRGREELRYRPLVGYPQRPFLGEVVDEVAVAQVGRYPARGRVRLRDVPLVLEHGHVVADGRARHAQLAGSGDALGTDGLRRLDVLLDA